MEDPLYALFYAILCKGFDHLQILVTLGGGFWNQLPVDTKGLWVKFGRGVKKYTPRKTKMAA